MRICLHRWLRLIPTYMGNAPGGPPYLHAGSVHPHVHGERLVSPRRIGKNNGSSPRTWGTRGVEREGGVRSRFIPTYMGNAHRDRLLPYSVSVHPHVHGERLSRTLKTISITGSSPRTWGTHALPARGSATVRFIPTYMGNAAEQGMPGNGYTVHPHVHGERLTPFSDRPTHYGSSPRTWGTRVHRIVQYRYRRFIPTYMGNANQLCSL